MALYQNLQTKETRYMDSKKKSLLVEGHTWNRIPKPRPKSRATRLGEAISGIQGTVQNLEDIKGDAENRTEMTGEWFLELVRRAQRESEMIEHGEIAELRDEMTSWRDNIEEHFSGTSKFEEVSEAAETLETQVDELESISFDFTDSPESTLEERAESLVEAIQEVIDAIENAVGELENVNFPSMF